MHREVRVNGSVLVVAEEAAEPVIAPDRRVKERAQT